MNQQAFWNAVAPTKTFSHPFDTARFASLVPREARVLDYGCGYGRVCRELRSAGYSNIIGVDPCRMIDRARAENPEITFRTLDADALPFIAESFDALLLFSVLTCIVDDGEQQAIVREIARVLRPDGILYRFADRLRVRRVPSIRRGPRWRWRVRTWGFRRVIGRTGNPRRAGSTLRR